MSDAVGSTAHAFDASREEQGLCPHEKNPAFDAGMVFFLIEVPFCCNAKRSGRSGVRAGLIQPHWAGLNRPMWAEQKEPITRLSIIS